MEWQPFPLPPPPPPPPPHQQHVQKMFRNWSNLCFRAGFLNFKDLFTESIEYMYTNDVVVFRAS